MNILAIESSCDETAAAVVRNGRDIRSSVVSSQIDVHQATGGVVPEVAARLQLELILPVIGQSLEEARTDWRSIDAIAVTQGPGLMGSLLVGIETAKTLALSEEMPLIPVNHLAGHLYACLVTESKFKFPYLGLVVSGGHTEFVLMTGHHEFELVGSTRDDAAGEAFDKVGKLLGLAYPAGPEIATLAEAGNPKTFAFPRAMLDQDNLDLSFSGLKTAVRQCIGERTLSQSEISDVAASFEAAVSDALVRKSLRAVRRHSPRAFLLGGGVAANRRLRKALGQELPIPLLATPPELATDNAAMIGVAAYWMKDLALSGADRLEVSADPSLALAATATS